MVKIERTGRFEKMLIDCASKDPEILVSTQSRLLLFRKNPLDTRLRNHPLSKSMQGKWAFSVSDDIRIIYEWVGKTTVRLLTIGTHPQVYPK